MKPLYQWHAGSLGGGPWRLSMHRAGLALPFQFETENLESLLAMMPWCGFWGPRP